MPARATPAETATSAPASAMPARPRRTPAAPSTSEAQSAEPSARAPSRRACPSSRSTAGKPTPAATAAATIQGRRHAAPNAATRANENAVTTTRPWSEATSEGSNGA